MVELLIKYVRSDYGSSSQENQKVKHLMFQGYLTALF